MTAGALTTGVLSILVILLVALAATGRWWYCVWKAERADEQRRAER